MTQEELIKEYKRLLNRQDWVQTCARLIMMCGLPASGKSYWAEKIQGTEPGHNIIVSSDKIRDEIYKKEHNLDIDVEIDSKIVFEYLKDRHSEVFEIAHKQTLEALNKGYNVIYDATNITIKDRAALLKQCPDWVDKICCIVWAPINECYNRDTKRKESVGWTVIDRMVKRFQMPGIDEGFKRIDLIRNWDGNLEQYKNKCFLDCRIPHDNSHHSLPVDAHMIAAGAYGLNNVYKLKTFNKEAIDITNAIMYHDIGKSYTKSFINSKGEYTDEAHYYQHQCVGAYMALGFGISLYSVWLISNHMEPHFNSKRYQRMPEFLKRELDFVHEADINADTYLTKPR